MCSKWDNSINLKYPTEADHHFVVEATEVATRCPHDIIAIHWSTTIATRVNECTRSLKVSTRLNSVGALSFFVSKMFIQLRQLQLVVAPPGRMTGYT